MAEKNFWLASNSPRRREMLGWLDWNFRIAAADIDESRQPAEPARDYVMRVSKQKAEVPIAGTDQGSVVIAADTIVVLDEEILGKPQDEEDAFSMLVALRGKTHFVHTAIAVRTNAEIQQDICSSAVTMRDYSIEEIRAYIATGDPMDKAGSYAIQNRAFSPVEHFGGCFASVMGLPLCHLERTLKKCGIFQPKHFAAVCQNHLKYSCPITDQVMAGENVG